MRYLLILLMMLAVPASAGIVIGTGSAGAETETTVYGHSNDVTVMYAANDEEAWSTSRNASSGTVASSTATTGNINASRLDADTFWENNISRMVLTFPIPAATSISSAVVHLQNTSHLGNHYVVAVAGAFPTNYPITRTDISITDDGTNMRVNLPSPLAVTAFNQSATGATITVSGCSNGGNNGTHGYQSTSTGYVLLSNTSAVTESAGATITVVGSQPQPSATYARFVASGDVGVSAEVTGTGDITISINPAYLTGKEGGYLRLMMMESDHDYVNSIPADGAEHGGVYALHNHATEAYRPRVVYTYTE